MQCLTVPPVAAPPAAWRADASAPWQTLPPLADASALLAACRTPVERLAHALGGSMPWFRRHAWPLLLQWEALVAGLPDCSPADGDVADRLAVAPGAVPSALARVLGQAAVAVDWPGAASPLTRLLAADRTARRQAWRCAAALRVADARGWRWEPRRQPCRSWRQTATPPLGWQPLGVAASDPALERALDLLVARGVWRDLPGRGRWLACRQGWGLLWPLAGRDLQRALAETTPQGQADPAAGAGAGLDAIPARLCAAGWRPAGIAVVAARRSDGREITLLPVAAALRRRCALDSALTTPATAVLLAATAPRCQRDPGGAPP